MHLPEKRGRRRWTGRRIARRRWWFPFTTGYAAVDGTASRKKRTAQKRGTTGGTAKASLGRVPVLTFVRHLTLVNAYRFATAVAIFGEGGIETTKTIWSSLPHNVPLTAELQLFHWLCIIAFKKLHLQLVFPKLFFFLFFTRNPCR